MEKTIYLDIVQKIKEIYGDEIAGRNDALIKLYYDWYTGYDEIFHNHRIYNGKNFINLCKKSMGMAKKVCETWADLLINEKCSISIDDEVKDNLNLILKNTNFWTKANQAVEVGFALSYAMLVGEITPDKKLKLVMVDARHALPLRVENGEIIDCAFYRHFEKRTRLNMWTRSPSGYIVTTVDFTSRGDIIPDSKVVLETGLPMPLFMTIKPNIISNKCGNKFNIGASVYGNCIDNFKALDTKYDGFDFEFIGGRKKVYISDDALQNVRLLNKDASANLQFDPLDSTYYHAGETGDDGKPLIQEAGGELRTQAYIDALNFELSLLSEKTGLGYGYFKIDVKGEMTATQVVSENSDLFRTIKKHEIYLKNEITKFIIAICEYSNKFCELKVGNYDLTKINIKFDDSIIEDKQAEKAADLVQVEKGIMTHVDYGIKWEGLTPEDSFKKYIYLDISQRANRILPLLESKLITPELAVNLIYSEKEPKINIKEIIENLKKDDLNIDDGEFEPNENTEE